MGRLRQGGVGPETWELGAPNMNDLYLTTRGQIRAFAASDNTLAFVTEHPEGQPTALYRLDIDKEKLTESPLPGGGVALVLDEDSAWIAGSDGALLKDGKPVKTGFELKIFGLVLLSDHRLALLAEESLGIFDRKAGKLVQTLPLPTEATVAATDPTGQWIAVGGKDGSVSIFDCEGKDTFQPGESAKLHEGPVTAMQFEPEELRFFSAGADNKLLLTHARGTLEPEDRGRSHGHSDAVTAMVVPPETDRLITGSRDQSCKSWRRTGKTQPATLGDGVGAVRDLAVAQSHSRSVLAVASGGDNSIRLFLIDPEGKLSHPTHRFHDAVAKARHELAATEPTVRGQALNDLAGYADAESLEILAWQIGQEKDHALRLRATELLAASDHSRAPKLLEPQLAHADNAVRIATLAGLRRQHGEDSLHPLELALDQPTVGPMAVEALVQLAPRDELAMNLLCKTIHRDLDETRLAAVPALESVHDKKSPEANLIALSSQHADVRKQAVIRMFQRKLLADAQVRSALRRAGDDPDADVRRTAFHVSLFASDKLVKAVRSRDVQFHRQLWELEQLGTRTRAKAPPKLKSVKVNLSPEDTMPLVQAMASRTMDTSLRGARALALLGDTRAFGLLLQLSRESNEDSRVQVCQALSSLEDERVVERLTSLLDDASETVREAAYTGLTKVQSKAPMLAAEAGLNSRYPDVRARALAALIRTTKKDKPEKEGDLGWDLLLRALNDSDEKVRNEAFKTVLNQEIGGGGSDSLRLVLQSSAADVRREVLTELMAQAGEPWAWEMLQEMFDDPDASLRQEAFEFAIKRTRGREAAPMLAALQSSHPDVRRLAVARLGTLSTDEAQAALAEAVSDDDKETRLAALQHLMSLQAVDAVRQALASPHLDTQLKAACALARHGDAAALKPLAQSASEPQPEEEALTKAWTQRMVFAFEGLAELGDPASWPQVEVWLDRPPAPVRHAAARAMVMVSRPDHLETLQDLRRNDDEAVSCRAALALALNEQNAGGLIFSGDEAQKALDHSECLAGTLALQQPLLPFLDSSDKKMSAVTSNLVLLLEASSVEHEPRLAMAGLSSVNPTVQYQCAEVVEAFASEKSMADCLEKRFNDRDYWDVSLETLMEVSAVLTNASNRLRLRILALLPWLDEAKPHAWRLAWALHRERFAPEIEACRAAVEKQKSAQRPPVEALQELVFGTFVGLARDAGLELSLRQFSIRHLVRLGQLDERNAVTVRQTLSQFLSDNQLPIRTQSLAALQILQADPAQLAGDCIESGQRDMGVEGLKLLSQGSVAQARKVLQEVALTRNDSLALDAANMLAEQSDEVSAAMPLVEARYAKTRSQAIAWLAANAHQAKAKKALHQALKSRIHQVRMQSAITLATQQDGAAYEALLNLLDAADSSSEQKTLITALEELGDRRTPAALLDRIHDDPRGVVDKSVFFAGVANFRQADVVDRLLSMLENQKLRDAAFTTLLTIAGYDQSLKRGWKHEAEADDHEWMKKQFARQDKVLTELLAACAELNFWTSEPVRAVTSSACFALSNEVDPVLATLAQHSDDELRHRTVEAISWRVQARGSDPEPLRTALGHKNPITKFLAAEGLALAGHDEGMNVLLAAIDLMDDLDFRRRAVNALGKLGDERAVDMLLKLASEDGHALQSQAAEAIGHMGRSDRSEEIFALLKQFTRADDINLAARAIRGLRWFDTREGWEQVRQQAEHGMEYVAATRTAVEALGDNDDPATRDLLLKLFSRDINKQVVMKSARKVFGEESLEPDYACCRSGSYVESSEKVFERLWERGEPDRLFDILPHTHEHQKIESILLNRDPMPVQAALESLDSEQASCVRVAARILGRGKPVRKSQDRLVAVIPFWLDRWRGAREKCRRDAYDHEADRKMRRSIEALETLFWACGRLDAGADKLAACLSELADESGALPIREAAVRALAEMSRLDAKALTALESAATDAQASIRELAMKALIHHNAKRAGGLAEAALSDRNSFRILGGQPAVDVATVLKTGAETPHVQAVVLPFIIDTEDRKTLIAVAQNRELPEWARLGAIESLAAMADKKAEDDLAGLGKSKNLGEELRKAAWRGLRRSKRAREKQEVMA